MSTADTHVVISRDRQHQSRDDSRPHATGLEGYGRERQHLFLSLKIVGCVTLALLFLALGIPGPAFVALAIGVIILGTSQPA